MSKVVIGKSYRHYKGGEYQVIALARHSETMVDLVVYQSQEEKEKIWARPFELFTSTVIVNGESVPRFSQITDL